MFVSAYFTVTFTLLTHMSAAISYKPDSNCEGTTAQRSNETWQMWLRRESEAEGEYLKPCWSWSWRTCSSPAFKTVSEYSKCIQLLSTADCSDPAEKMITPSSSVITLTLLLSRCSSSLTSSTLFTAVWCSSVLCSSLCSCCSSCRTTTLCQNKPPASASF